MAKFLTTAGITDSLEKIIKQARKRLILISPYLQINLRIRNLIEEKDREIRTKVESPFSKVKDFITNEGIQRDMKIIIVYRTGEVKADERSWLQGIHSIQTIALNNLHAKIYLNENYALHTSMNLYQSSQENNYETGILVTRGNWNDRERKLYNAISKHAEELIRYGKEENSPTPIPTEVIAATPSPPKQPTRRRTMAATLERPSTGYCIRCDDSIAIESQPFCEKGWQTWNQHKKDGWPGNDCLFCKAPKKFKRQPLCLKCYRKHESILKKYKSILGL